MVEIWCEKALLPCRWFGGGLKIDKATIKAKITALKKEFARLKEIAPLNLPNLNLNSRENSANLQNSAKSPHPCESGAKSPPPLRRGVWGVGNETHENGVNLSENSQNSVNLMVESVENSQIFQNDNFANAKFTHPQTPSAREGALNSANSTTQGEGAFEVRNSQNALANGANQKSPVASGDFPLKSPSLAEGDLGGGYENADFPFALPHSWAWVRLGDICNLFTGDSINAAEKAKKFTNLAQGVNYIGTKDISERREIDYENGVKIPQNALEKFKIAPQNSTLLCIEGGSAGRKVGFLEQSVCFGNKLCCFEPVFVAPKFVYFYLQNSHFLDEFNGSMTGIIGGVGKDKIEKFLIPLPPLKEQEFIAQSLERLFAISKGLKSE